MTISEQFLTIGFWTVMFWLTVRFGKYIHQEYIFNPLAGGNGKIQINEIAQGSIVALFIYSVHKEATRDHEWAIFAEAYWWSLMFGIFSVAGLKHIKHWTGGKQDHHKPEKKSEEPPVVD